MWLKARIVLMALMAVGSFAMSPREVAVWSAFPHPALVLAIVGVLAFFCIPIGNLFVLGIQAINPFSAPVWKAPNWSSTFLTFRDPLQFFHLAGWLCIASGCGLVFGTVIAGPLALLLGAIQILGGIVELASLRLCMRVFHSKFQPPVQPPVSTPPAAVSNSQPWLPFARPIGIVLLASAVVCASLAFCYYVSTTRFMEKAVKVNGTVVALEETSDQTYKVVAEFKDASGLTHRAVSSWSSSPPSHSIGDRVFVFYYPDEPSRTVVGSTDLWIVLLVAIPFTLINLLVAVVLIWVLPRKYRKARS